MTSFSKITRTAVIGFIGLSSCQLFHSSLSHGKTNITSTHSLYFSGSESDVSRVTSPSYLLVGGGDDRDDAMQWFVDKSGKGDIVILRGSGDSGYNDWLIEKGANSVTSIVLKSRDASNDPDILNRVRKSEALFFAGGDQSNYLQYIKGTSLAQEINAASKRGIPIGGTSAGLAILGQFVFPATHGTITSQQVLKNPYEPALVLERDFLNFPVLTGIITDSHFVSRDRMGRLLVFMARILHDGWSENVRGIGIDDQVALAIDQNAKATVFADDGKVYMIQATTKPETCRENFALSFKSLAVYRMSAGSTFDLENWSGTGGAHYNLEVQSGVMMSSDQAIY